MKRSGRFEFWMGGTTGALCLLLLNILVWQMRHDPRSRPVGEPADQSAAITRRLQAPSRKSPKLHPDEAALTPTAAKKNGSHVPVHTANKPFKSRQVDRIVTLPPAKAHLEAAASPQPKITTLEPLGYVVKTDGQVEAIISLAGNVQIVHEGDAYGDAYKVGKISPTAVELVENSPQPAEPVLSAQVKEGAAPGSSVKPARTNPPSAPQVIASTGLTCQIDAASAKSNSQQPAQNGLGYVEKMDGKVEAIVAEGDDVRLIETTKSFTREFHATEPAMARVEPSSTSPLPANEQASLGNPEVTHGYPGYSGGDVSTVASPADSTAYSTGVRQPAVTQGGLDELDAQVAETLQPEAMADYAGGEFRATPPETPSVAVPPPDMPVLPLESGVNNSPVRILGYVETADGKMKAIIDVADEVYVANNGDLLAEKYRVSQVSPSAIEVLEETTAAPAIPAEPGPSPKESAGQPEPAITRKPGSERGKVLKNKAIALGASAEQEAENETQPPLRGITPSDLIELARGETRTASAQARGADLSSARNELAANGSTLGALPLKTGSMEEGCRLVGGCVQIAEMTAGSSSPQMLCGTGSSVQGNQGLPGLTH
jgi:Tfp pilus assembly protein PilP